MRHRIFRASFGIASAACACLSGATVAAPLGTSLVVNGDAESGTTTGFATTGSFAALAYGTGGGFPTTGDPGVAQGGSFFFYGGPSDLSTGMQLIDLSENGIAIDLGNVSYNLSALLGGYADQEDAALITASFLGATGNVLGASSLGPVTAADRSNMTGLLERSVAGLLPTGTRSVDVTITMTKAAGSDNDAYVDNLSFVLDQNASPGDVPEPASWAMMISGFGLVGAAARRTRRTVNFAV